jgi:hypothetical protein
MSLFTSGVVQPGALRPLQDGGGTDYYTQKTKVSQFAKANVVPSYGFKIYESAPSPFDERSGHTATVVGRPDSKAMGQPTINDIFTPSDPEMEKLTQYFSRVAPSAVKSINASITIKNYGLKGLLERYIQGKLQDDVNVVNARMAGATEVERQLAMARLQDRYSEFVRAYGSEERLRQALLAEYVGGIPDPAVRGALANEIRAETQMGGATTMALSADAGVATPAGPVGDVDRATYIDQADAEMEESNLDGEAMRSEEMIRQRRERLSIITEQVSRYEGELTDLAREAQEIDSMRGMGQAVGSDVVKRQKAIQRRATNLRRIVDGLRSEYDSIVEFIVAEENGAVAQPTASVRNPEEFDGQTEDIDTAVPMKAEALPAGEGDGLSMGAGNPGADTEYSTGSFVPGHQRERGIAGGHGSVRSIVERIERQPPSAPSSALASADLGASQAYRQEVVARGTGGLFSESSIFGGASTVSGSVVSDPRAMSASAGGAEAGVSPRAVAPPSARVHGGALGGGRGRGRTLRIDA